jgi:excisionase family DNA binding protein
MRITLLGTGTPSPSLERQSSGYLIDVAGDLLVLDHGPGAHHRLLESGRRAVYSVEEVASRLGLHVRTVRAYLRTGRLKGVRIGKQYRISREDLDHLTGQSSPYVAEPIRRHRHVDLSTVVQVDVISPEAVDRVTNMLMAAAKAPREEDQPLRIDTTYDAERARLKVFISGSVDTTISMIELVKTLVGREGADNRNLQV